MKRLLVTTAVEETWGQEQDILFLGDWCKLYKTKEKWNNRVHDTVLFHEKNRVKFAADHEYLVILHEKVLSAVAKKLNEYHNTDHSLRYWRIVVGPWLSIFVPTIWERWESLKVAFLEHEFDEVFVADSSVCDFAKLDYQASAESLQEQILNYQIYSDIIQFQYGDSSSIKTLNVKNNFFYKVSSVPKKSITQILQRFIDNIMSKIQKKYNVVFISSYFDIISLFKLSIKLRQLPRRYFQFEDDLFQNKIEITDRKISIDLHCNNDFERYLSSNLFKNIPYSYVEGFSVLKERAFKCNVNGKIIFTSNSHFSNDFFKVWSAEQVINNNSKFFISVHGGAIPPSMCAFARHEDMVSDKYIVWHKALDKKQVQLPPHKFLKNKSRSLKNKMDVTIIGLDLGLYSYGHQSGTGSSLNLDDFNQKVAFIQNSSALLQKEIKVFPYPHPGWDTKSRYIDIFGEQVISSKDSFSDAIYTSKLIVCTYPQTTFSEAMFSNTPVVLLYVKEYWELQLEFNELLDAMIEAKIIFSDPTLAAQHVSEIYLKSEVWWESDIVVAARKLFHDSCLSLSNDWLTEWSLFFESELDK